MPFVPIIYDSISRTVVDSLVPAMYHTDHRQRANSDMSIDPASHVVARCLPTLPLRVQLDL